MIRLVTLIAFAFTLNGFSAETPTTAATVTTQSDAKILAGVDLRTVAYGNGENDTTYGTENNVIGGYRFDKDTWVYYRQDFGTNLSNSNGAEGGLGLYAADGSLRGGINNIWKDGNWSVSYEGRAYVPTSDFSSDSGMITYVRNYGYLNYAVTDAFTLYVAESPTFHFYSQDLNVRGTPNTNIENRTYLGANYAFTSDLKLYFPIKMSNAHLRVSAGDRNWTHKVYINPELFYSLDQNFKIGLGIETASFVDATFGDFSVSTAFQGARSYAALIANL